MDNIINLSDAIEKRLQPGLVELIQTAGLVAADRGQSIYLVGGIVRDLLLERPSPDIDLVVEGDAVDMAYRLAAIVQGKVTVHLRFRTANIRWDNLSIDLATARSETYARPGALPTVEAGFLDTDLFRRDFTINAMAVDLSPGNWGRLIDLYDGMSDIENRLIRILHENSFIDDATRIWRAIRYEQRLDFSIEQDTLRLLRQNIEMLDTISKDRIRRELELVMAEEQPEKAIRRAAELGVLEKLHPSLAGDDWITDRFTEARKITSPDIPPAELYLALLTYRLNNKEVEEFISSLRLRKVHALTLRDTSLLKSRLGELEKPGISPGGIYDRLNGLSRQALNAVSIACDSAAAKANIDLYLTRLCHVKTSLTGKDLQKMGIPPGPEMKDIINRLLHARLNGEITDKKGEAEMVGEMNILDNKSL